MNFIIKINLTGSAKVTFGNNGFQKYELDVLLPALEQAYRLAGYHGAVDIYRGKTSPYTNEETASAVISWPFIFGKPKIVIAPEIFDYNDAYNYLGLTLTHELIHARQGVWKVFWQNLIWTVLMKHGEPPIEEEAYNSVNLWWDNIDIF